MHLIGQENNVKYFENAMARNKLHHCYLIHGKRGVGKKTFVNEIAKFLLCGNWNCKCRICTNIDNGNHPDVSFFYSNDAIVKLDTVEEFKKTAIFSPLEGSKKIVVLGGVDRLNTQGANKLLTLIEEPPPYLTIFLLCENIVKVINTIKSRAVKLRINSLTRNQIIENLFRSHNLGQAEGEVIAFFSGGALGQAEELMAMDFLDIRRDIYNLLWETWEKGIDYVKINKIIENQDSNIVLDLLEFWFRDLLYLKIGESRDMLINKDYYDKLISIKIKNPEELINKVKIIRNTLKNSINPMLNFEVIFNSLQEE